VVQGGTDLRVDWKTPCSTANTGNNLTPEELAQDSLYDALIAKAMEIQDPDTLAQYFPQYAGKTAQVVGFVWFQGWNDGLNPLNQTNYKTNMTCLLNDLRSDLGQSSLPVVIAQSHVGEPDNLVQVGQAEVAAEFDNTELAVTDDLSGYYHYDNAAQLVIGQRMANAMTSLLVFDAVPPVAHDQHVRMRAAEFLAKPITLAATPASDNPMSYAIVSGPSNGSLSGIAPHIEYVPDSTFRGQDSFTFTASHAGADSNIATVTIEVIQENCPTAKIGGPADSLFLHVPSHMVTADISAYEHAVLLEGEPLHESASSDPCVAGHVPWVSRNDLAERSIVIDLGASTVIAPLSISFKLIPVSNEQDQIIMQSDAFVIEQSEGAVASTFYYPRGVTVAVSDSGALKTRSCNHLGVVVGGAEHTIYLNGKPTQAAANISAIRPVEGAIVIGPYPGKVWDIRMYERALSQEEILELGGADCSDELLATSPDANYPNYLCGVYVCEWWPDGTDLTMENYQYYLAAQDSVYERNFFEAGMYPRDNLCDYFLNDSGRDLMLSEGIRNTFVRPWDFSDPLRQRNGEYWLHENFHSFQGRLGGYLGRGGSKFLLESTASWGADHQIPAVMDTLLGYYSMHPHLPLWTIQNSPVDDRAGHEFKGGHQYGAYIFWSYLTNYIVGKGLIGDIFNDTRAGSRPAEAAYDLLALQGHDMKPIFADFAARITTWDMKDGPEYADAEEASLRRMRSAKPDAETHDNKITAFYDSNGTGNEWTSVPEDYIPGSWGFNAYKIDVTEDVDYIVSINPDVSNPAYADFRARVVVHDKDTGRRSYHTLGIAGRGEPLSISVPTRTGDELYLVVAATPDIFSGWDWYRYEFKIYPDRIVPPLAAPTNLSALGEEDQVSLDWDDNTEPNLVGYNVYRSTTSGHG
ncbi:MAG: sialate O-acetylesterase, partial [Planctomycetota bacterium]